MIYSRNVFSSHATSSLKKSANSPPRTQCRRNSEAQETDLRNNNYLLLLTLLARERERFTNPSINIKGTVSELLTVVVPKLLCLLMSRVVPLLSRVAYRPIHGD